MDKKLAFALVWNITKKQKLTMKSGPGSMGRKMDFHSVRLMPKASGLNCSGGVHQWSKKWPKNEVSSKGNFRLTWYTKHENLVQKGKGH